MGKAERQRQAEVPCGGVQQKEAEVEEGGRVPYNILVGLRDPWREEECGGQGTPRGDQT